MRKMQIYFCTLFFFLPLVHDKIVKFRENVTLDCIENKTPVEYMFWKFKYETGHVWKEIFSINGTIENPLFENVIYPAGDFKNGNFSITLRSITFEHVGRYACYTQIHGTNAKQTSVFNIEVVGWVQNDRVPLGGTLNLHLYTNGSVQLNFLGNGSWYNVGKIQINSQKCDLDERYKNRSEIDHEVLRINNFSYDDAGNYTVQDERSGRNISTVRAEVTSPKDFSNSTRKNSEEQGTTMRHRIIPMVVGIIFIALLLVLSIRMYKKHRTSGPTNGSRFAVSY